MILYKVANFFEDRKNGPAAPEEKIGSARKLDQSYSTVSIGKVLS